MAEIVIEAEDILKMFVFDESGKSSVRSTKQNNDGSGKTDGYTTVLSRVVKKKFGFATKGGSGFRDGERPSMYLVCTAHNNRFIIKSTSKVERGQAQSFWISRKTPCNCGKFQ